MDFSSSSTPSRPLIPTNQLLLALEQEEKRLRKVEADLLLIVTKQEQEIESLQQSNVEIQTHFKESCNLVLSPLYIDI
jgi:hypothetical protein